MTEDCVILFADLAGSVSLYARVGDEAARVHVQVLQRLMTGHIVDFQGQVQEIIGDELMVRFDEPDAALGCSIALHRCAKEYSLQCDFNLQLRIGLHYGPVIVDEEEDRLFGDTVNVASRVTGIAQAGQTIATDWLTKKASSTWQASLRRFDVTHIKGKTEPLLVYDLPWQQDGLTAIVSLDSQCGSRADQPVLTISHGNSSLTLCEHDDAYTVGRAMTNDLVLPADPVSRRHISIERARDHYVLNDLSTNGTHLYLDHGETLYLRRQQWPMSGAGMLALGAPREHGDDHIVYFTCTHA